MNLATTGAANTYTITIKLLKGEHLEALFMHITKAKLVVKGVLIKSKEELQVLGSVIFELHYEQNFLSAVKNLSNKADTDLDNI